MKTALVAALARLPSGAAQRKRLSDSRLIRSRAVEAVIWGMPAVNYDLLPAVLTKTPGKVNQVSTGASRSIWQNQTLTPNPDALGFSRFRQSELRRCLF